MKKILDDLITKTNDKSCNEKVIDASINLQGSVENEIVFYNLHDSDSARVVFFERLIDSRASVVCVSSDSVDFFVGREIKQQLLVVAPKDFLAAQKRVLDVLYPIKEGAVKLVGVTGTNGKTSTVILAMQAAEMVGKKAVSVGTIGIIDQAGNVIKADGTTSPSFITTRKLIYRYQDAIDVIFFEVSSHALAQQRFFDLKFDCGGWTSFSQDHLDFHGNMEAYFLEKMKIFDVIKESGHIWLPEHERNLIEQIIKSSKECKQRTCVARAIEAEGLDLSFKINFFRANLEVALALNEELFGKLDYYAIKKYKFILPEGRSNTFSFGESVVVVDFAHTPDGLEKMLIAIKKSFPGYSLTTLFGCGGDRDRTKRPLMGKIASENSDRVIITSDNTRTEDPKRIVDDVVAGIRDKEKVTLVLDRRVAIKQALTNVKKHELLLIAGRGHEKIWEYNGAKIKFCDLDAVKQYIKSELRNG